MTPKSHAGRKLKWFSVAYIIVNTSWYIGCEGPQAGGSASYNRIEIDQNLPQSGAPLIETDNETRSTGIDIRFAASAASQSNVFDRRRFSSRSPGGRKPAC